MAVNSKKRFQNVVALVVFVMLFMVFGNVKAFAMTQISKISVTITENSWDQTINPTVKSSSSGYELVSDSVIYSQDVSSCSPGDKITISCKIRSKEGYAFRDNLTKSYFSISNGTYQSAKEDSGDILLKINYTVRGYLDEPDNLRWSGTRAKWDSVSNSANYTLKICKGNGSSTTVAENITGTSYDLSSYLNSSTYCDRDDVYFKVKAVPKNSCSDFLKASDYAESDYFDDDYDYDDYDHDRHGWNGELRPTPRNNVSYNNYSYNSYGPSSYSTYSGYWQQTSDGAWYYYENGTTLKNCTRDINGKTYYFLSNGKMATSWQLINGNWYFFDPIDGYMYKQRWALVNGSWYYLRADGSMITGWFTDTDGRIYYLSSSGAMVIGWNQINGVYHYFNDVSGALEK